MDLKSQFEKRKIGRIDCYQGVNLYVKNLDDTIDDVRLREEFSAYGTIISATVMMDDKNNSKGMVPSLRKINIDLFCKILPSLVVHECLNFAF